MKKIFLLIALVLTFLPGLRAANAYGLPEGIQEGNILHCFDWKHTDIIAELPNIATAGFGAIQISPMERNISVGTIWYDVYRPYDFKLIDNQMGTRETLTQLCAEAAKYGIKIVVDVVANHIDANGPHDEWWNSNNRQRSNSASINYNNRTSITTGRMGYYGDVNTENKDVQQRVKDYLAELKACGVAGIRWDATKHIGLPSEGSDFWPTVLENSGLYHYGEILGSPGGSNANTLMAEYAGLLSVTDDGISSDLRGNVQGGNFPQTLGNWKNRGIDGKKLVYWGESHDTYANSGGATTNLDQNVIDRTWALLSAFRDESSLYFSRPPFKAVSDITIGQKGSTHFASPEVAAVNHLRNAAGDAEAVYVRAQSQKAAMVARKGVGAVIVCVTGSEGSVTLNNTNAGLPTGSYVDEVSGNKFNVTAQGIKGDVGPTGIAVIYKSDAAVPVMTLTPGSGTSFRSETLDITARAMNFTSGWVKVGGKTTNLEANNSSKTITIGEGVAANTDITVEWSVTNGTVTTTGTAVYHKRAALGSICVWFDNPDGWAQPTLHYYNTTGGTTWPGATMQLDADKNMWFVQLPEDFAEGCNVIVSNNGANQYPTGEGLRLDAQTMLLKGQEWGKSDLTPSDNIAQSEPDGIWLVNDKNWTKPCVWAWNSSSSGASGGFTVATAYPGDAMTWVEEKQMWHWSPAKNLPANVKLSDGNGGDSRGNQSFVNHGIYHSNSTTIEQGPSGLDREPETEFYVYLRNVEGLTAPTAWAWDGDFNCTATVTWPGDGLTFDAELNLWRWDLPATATYPASIMFTEKDDNEAFKSQPQQFVNRGVYVVDPSNERKLLVDDFEDCPVVYLDGSDLEWAQPCVSYEGGTLSGYHEKMTLMPAKSRAAGDVWVYTLPKGTTTVTFTNGWELSSESFEVVDEKVYSFNINSVVTNIDSIDAMTDAPVMWFDLHGRRVLNPGVGVYIIRQGDATVKVVR